MSRATVRNRDRPAAREEAERATQQAVRELSSRLAHQLGNLLQVVNGNLELIAQRTNDETARHYLANARAAADQLTELARALATDPED